MSNVSLIKKMAILSSAFAIIAFLLIFFFAIPLFNDVDYYSKQIISLGREFSLLEEESRQAQEFDEAKIDLKENFEKMDGVFADREVPIEFIKFLEDSANKGSLEADIFPLSVVAENHYKWDSLGFKISLYGSFPETLRFIERIEKGPYLIQIQGMSSGKSGLQLERVSLKEGVNTDIKLIVFVK